MLHKSIEYEEFNTDKVSEYAKEMKSFFCYHADINRNAYLNWRMGYSDSQRRQLVVMSDAFFDTAYNLLLQCLEDNDDKKADIWIFPILFNVVHGIEIYLKAINVSLNLVLSKSNIKIQGNHNIQQLCETAESLVLEYKNRNRNATTEQMFLGIKLVRNFIDNIYQKTSDMTFARYPMSKNKNGHFYIQTLDNEVVNLDMLREQMLFVYKMLSFVYEMPELEVDVRAEAMQDYY